MGYLNWIFVETINERRKILRLLYFILIVQFHSNNTHSHCVFTHLTIKQGASKLQARKPSKTDTIYSVCFWIILRQLGGILYLS